MPVVVVTKPSQTFHCAKDDDPMKGTNTRIVDHEVLTCCHSGHGWCKNNLCCTCGKGGWSYLSTPHLHEMAHLMLQPVLMTAAASSDTATMLSMTMQCGGSLVPTACCRMLPLTLATSTDVTFGGWQCSPHSSGRVSLVASSTGVESRPLHEETSHCQVILDCDGPASTCNY